MKQIIISACACGWKERLCEHILTFPFCLLHSGAVIMSFFLLRNKEFSVAPSLPSWWHTARVCGWATICWASPGHKSWIAGEDEYEWKYHGRLSSNVPIKLSICSKPCYAFKRFESSEGPVITRDASEAVSSTGGPSGRDRGSFCHG